MSLLGALTERRFRDFSLGVGAVAVVALLGAVALGFGTLAAYVYFRASQEEFVGAALIIVRRQNRLYGVFTQNDFNYGQENRECQSPQSEMNFEQRSRRTTHNKTRESRERHPNTVYSPGPFPQARP